MPVIYNKKVEYAYTDPGVKAHTLSWAEYQALSEDDKMNGDLYFIPDKQPEGNPSRIWTKLGTDPLTTQADDVSGAVNELNSSITNLATIESVQSSTIAVGGTYQIPSNILNHKLILFEIRRQGYGGAMLFEKNNLLLIDNGFSIRVTANDYYTFKCSPTGLITLVAKSSGVSDVFIFVHGLF